MNTDINSIPSMDYMIYHAPTKEILDRLLLEATTYRASKKTREQWQKSYHCAMTRLGQKEMEKTMVDARME